MHLYNDNFREIILLFAEFDRYTPLSMLPKDCIHFQKEVFKYDKYIIKKTNYKKNGNKDHYLFENEAFWLNKLQKYSFVPKFFGKYYYENDIYLIIEYIHGISINKIDRIFLKQFVPFFKLFEEKLHEVLYTFTRENITHKDLRPHNIIINFSFNDYKIIDYQFCSRIGKDLVTNCKVQNDHYKKAINSVGGEWRMPGIHSHNFTTDQYAVDKILDELQSRIFKLQNSTYSRLCSFMDQLKSIINRNG